MTKAELRQPIGTGMLYLESALARAQDPVFEAWVNKHHGEFLANVSGALSVRRFEWVPTKFSPPEATHPVLTVYQLADHTALGVILRYSVRAIPNAILATDARIGAVQNNTGRRNPSSSRTNSSQSNGSSVRCLYVSINASPSTARFRLATRCDASSWSCSVRVS